MLFKFEESKEMNKNEETLVNTSTIDLNHGSNDVISKFSLKRITWINFRK